MKRTILMSLLVIGAVVAVMVGATTAYFSDPETATGTFSAGTIDISVDGQNPWTGSFTMADLKPCETGEIAFTIHNPGENPVVVWKHIGGVATSGGEHPESEMAADPGDTQNNIHTVTIYDLKVDDTVIFADADGLTVNDIRSMWMPLGTIPPHGSMEVEQSYHLDPATGNWAQGDTMSFNIDLYAEQELGNGPGQLSQKLFLDNKSGDPDWYFIADGTWGILTWGSTGEVTAQGLEPGIEYDLATYPDPWPGIGLQVFCTGTADTGGNLALTGCAMPSPYDGKIWLVLSSDNDGNQMTAWQPTRYLFEANKVSIP